MIRRQWSRSTSSQAMKGTIAALLTSTSILPCSSSTESTIAPTESSEETSTSIALPALERRRRLLGALGVDVGDDDGRPLGVELLGDRPADALRGAGDDRDPVGELHLLPRFRS